MAESNDRPDRPEQDGPTRKTLLRAALVAVPAAALPATAGAVPALARDRAAGGRLLDPTPQCDDGDDPTPPQMEGPYFKPDSPNRSDLVVPGDPGVPLAVSGYVFTRDCRPVAGALLDFWQADDAGVYDNAGYDYRGHQYTAADGAFRLTTIVPGLYPGRTRHLHVKVQAPSRPVLTTQLYFPGEPRNETDLIFDPRLLMDVRDDGAGKAAGFDFVLDFTA
ncbi:dioxygenase [Nocardiopsis composta]|uniref:Protocatechuate 3,4-dioxygenase beta subunit n=1 Tax=Nocardiopsis composta TaxID=157465 RepID=A0A7W8QP06_9ACTN|nr:dioxygenase [Nocardiopsis composta]MBB5433804.1 protocatechuate 3,4-dioxygenase beta subunit [Nocardiopsis composta]